MDGAANATPVASYCPRSSKLNIHSIKTLACRYLWKALRITQPMRNNQPITQRERTSSNSIASSHILALNYDHWHYSFVARYFHNGGQWNDGVDIGTPQGPIKSTGWGYYLVAGYNF